MSLKAITSWCPPPFGFMKFNIDGSVRGKLEQLGIGEVLENELGVLKGMFSKTVGVMDSNHVELLAILEALMVFVEFDFLPLFL